MSGMFALHSGEFFGGIGQALMFVASLMMSLFGITGLMMYLKKRKVKPRV
jgi:sulfite reductase (NADPH) flavoprotein alpha-component